MWLAAYHRRLDTASGQAPSNQTKSLFMTVDSMAIDLTVKSDGFLPNHGSDSYGTWCGGCQGPRVHDARESSATEPSKSVADLMTTVVMAYISF